jgi:hypothetical protein
MNQAHLLEGTKGYASFTRPDAETSLAVSVEPFQLGGLHMMCWAWHILLFMLHILWTEFVFEVPSGTHAC